ncbi:MAG: SH3 domain-containing protein [Lachnospiraceae bacterium]|nr:SH3 domain-containing protein [Lachnospiraceae bacterium]
MKLLNNKKFILQSIASFAVLLMCVFMLSIYAKADTPGIVNENNVNIRSQADATSTSLGKVNSGDKVTILEEITNSSNVLWYKVTTAAGTTGYIRADFITKANSGDDGGLDNGNNNDPTVTDTDPKAAYIVGDVVNIRSKASASSDLIAKAQKNTEVTVVGETKATDGFKWYKVSFTADGAKKTGFIRSDLVTFTKPTNDPEETVIDSEDNTDTDNGQDNTDNGGDAATTDDTPVTPDSGETGDTVVSEPKREITPLQPYEDPANLPDGFTEGQLGSGEKVWTKGDYYIIYGMNEKEVTGWYVLDEKNSTYISYEGLFDKGSSSSKPAGTIFGINIKVILIILMILVIILLGVVFFMALKLSRGVENDDDYDYDDYEDEEEEDDIPVSSIENSRGSRSSGKAAKAVEEDEPKQSKASKAKDKFLNYFTTEVDDDDDDGEYYNDDDDDDDIDFIDI